eukprot:4680238-Lingulodinium_polyedra.AAC.1
MWAEACWEEPGKWPAMQQAWSSSRAWLRRGPTGAVARVCKRLGWQWQAFDRLVTAEGCVVDLKVHCPTDVVAMVVRSATKLLWQ